MKPADLLIGKDLASLLTPHTEVELGILEDSLRTDGLLSPLLVWPTEGRLVLLDGFARLKLTTKLGIAIRWTEVPLPDATTAVEFRLKQQLARRNLPPIAQAYLRGRLYLLAGKRQGARTDLPKGKADAQMTAAGVAERFNCSERTIRRDQRMAEAIDRIGHPGQQGPEFKALLLAGHSRMTRRRVLQLARMGRVEQKSYLDRIKKEQGNRKHPRRKPTATPKTATTDRNSGADPPAIARPAGPTAAGVPSVGGWPKAPNAVSADERQQACPTLARAAVARKTVDDDLLGRLTDLWRQANHDTRFAFLDQPVVQATIQRLNVASEVIE